MIVLGIDPGTTESGWCVLGEEEVLASGVATNGAILSILRREYNHILPMELSLLQDLLNTVDLLAVEMMVASYGKAIGKETFTTVLWIGRFVEAWESRSGTARLVTRNQSRMELCGSPRANDSHVRQRLIDILGPKGTKSEPGPTYGVKSHAWPALGVALVASGREIKW